MPAEAPLHPEALRASTRHGTTHLGGQRRNLTADSGSLGRTLALVVRGGGGAVIALVTAVLAGSRPGPVDEDASAGRGVAGAEPVQPVRGEVGGERGGQPGGERVISAAACTPGERDVAFLACGELWDHVGSRRSP